MPTTTLALWPSNGLCSGDFRQVWQKNTGSTLVRGTLLRYILTVCWRKIPILGPTNISKYKFKYTMVVINDKATLERQRFGAARRFILWWGGGGGEKHYIWTQYISDVNTCGHQLCLKRMFISIKPLHSRHFPLYTVHYCVYIKNNVAIFPTSSYILPEKCLQRFNECQSNTLSDASTSTVLSQHHSSCVSKDCITVTS